MAAQGMTWGTLAWVPPTWAPMTGSLAPHTACMGLMAWLTWVHPR